MARPPPHGTSAAAAPKNELVMRIVPAVKRLLLQVLLLLAIYGGSRLVFTLLNHSFFESMDVRTYLHLALYGIRFDLAIICILNILYVILLLFPFKVKRLYWWEPFMHWLFVGVNGIALLFEMSDWAYYPFTLKRATADVLDMVTRKGDFWSLLPHFITDDWYVVVGVVIAIYALIKLNRKIIRRYPLPDPSSLEVKEESVSGRVVLFLIIIGLIVVGIRGGLQRTAINRSFALQADDGKYASIVLNTPFSIVSTLSHSQLPEYNFYPEKVAAENIVPIKHYTGKPFQKKNVVVIMLESFSKQYTGLGNFKSYTPFLDSLMQHSYVCTNAYANALHSAEGIPAVIAGIPSLMEEPITTSVYGIDRITALPRLLKTKGYNTAFYHGGTNGTMSFDQFAVNAGYDKYYGRTEYDNEEDYDGNWGIWDEPYLQYCAQSMAKAKQPFMASIFTLSSHDPFKVPEKYEQVLPQGPIENLQSIAYTDMALRKYFETVSKLPYYNNTLFVITADHCSLMTQEEIDHNNMGFYRIPILFFAPGDTAMKGSTDMLTQQIDILPSVLDYLGYDKPFFAFGKSIFTPAANRIVLNELNNAYQFVWGNYIFKTKELEITGIFNFKNDFKCWDNLIEKPEGIAARKAAEPYYKSLLQIYHYALIHDKMIVEL
jgi:phosphoglycerol transferase MdoB-like AlkP superfamily enzyme